MSELATQRKARGAFFTPPEMARFITQWAIRSASDRVLEPSCGEAEFLIAAGHRLRALIRDPKPSGTLTGIEIHEDSASIARERTLAAGFEADIRVGNFFDLPATAEYDAVIGNPPYIRYQDFAGTDRSKALEAALQHGVRFNNLISAWAPFVVHAAASLKPNGRLGLVLPAELLSVNYAAEVRRFILQRFGRVRIVMFEELVFPGVLEEVVLLLAEGAGPADHFEVYQARDLEELTRLDDIAWIPFTPGRDEKWLRAIIPSDALALYTQLTEDDDFENLLAWGDTYLGMVTGNNRFFTLSKAAAEERGLSERELVAISPPGSRHLRGLTFHYDDWNQLASAGHAVYLFAPDPADLSESALKYIHAGEITRVHTAYKCHIRTPWWQVPSVQVADLFLTYMDQHRPRILANRAGVHHLNSIYGIKLHGDRKEIGMDLLPLAAINTLTNLGAELVGRAYGGGLLKLEPKEADQLPVPAHGTLERVARELRDIQPQVETMLYQGQLESATKAVDNVLLMNGLGLSEQDLDKLRKARNILYDRRRRRSNRKNVED